MHAQMGGTNLGVMQANFAKCGHHCNAHVIL
jgi:hypothetical protein